MLKTFDVYSRSGSMRKLGLTRNLSAQSPVMSPKSRISRTKTKSSRDLKKSKINAKRRPRRTKSMVARKGMDIKISKSPKANKTSNKTPKQAKPRNSAIDVRVVTDAVNDVVGYRNRRAGSTSVTVSRPRVTGLSPVIDNFDSTENSPFGDDQPQ